MRYPEGSNGGVHRGPDKFPRRNAVRAVFLHAMAQDQEREQIDPSTGTPVRGPDGQPMKAKVKFAMVQDIVLAYQLIARHAAEGKDLDQFLRMMRDAHKMLQPAKDEAGEGRAPIPARFVLAQDTPDPEPEGDGEATRPSPATTASPTTTKAPSGAIMTADGKVYE